MKQTTYTFTGQRGITDLRDGPAEIWTAEEAARVERMRPIWDRFNRWYVGWLKRQGRYGEEYKINVTLIDNPEFDKPKLIGSADMAFPLESFRLMFFNDTETP